MWSTSVFCLYSTMSNLSLSQRRALSLFPKITGWLSLLFSSLLVVIVLRDKKRRSLCYHRLMLGVSLADISASLWFGLSTWPIPRGSQTWALGNAATCRVQGFFVQCSVMSSFYNASLSIYFWLVIVKGWNEKKLKRIEWLLHAVPCCWALGTACMGLYLDVYDEALLWCWVSPEWQIFRWVAYYVPLWVMISIVIMSCTAIFRHVRRLELQTAKSRTLRLNSSSNEFSSDTRYQEMEEKAAAQPSFINEELNRSPNICPYRQSQRVKQVAQQCFLYAAAFFVNWGALTVRCPENSAWSCVFLRSKLSVFSNKF